MGLDQKNNSIKQVELISIPPILPFTRRNCPYRVRLSHSHFSTHSTKELAPPSPCSFVTKESTILVEITFRMLRAAAKDVEEDAQSGHGSTVIVVPLTEPGLTSTKNLGPTEFKNMRNSKSAILLQRALAIGKPSNGWRRFTSFSCNPLIDDSDNLVVVEGNAGSRKAILNRPSSLNAINSPMVARLQKLYKSWEENPDIGFVVVKGAGRSFSAGGDIIALYNMLKQGNIEDCKHFFWTVYSFIYFLGTYLKSHVALLNGITMGGGAGISIPGTFRVATDKTIFATPETLIGFHTDAAASFYLSHLPGYLGEYLALTGEKLRGAEMLSCGLATHFTPLMKLPLLEEKLSNLITDDPCILEASLSNLGDVVPLDHSSVIHRIDLIDKCFSHDTVGEIIDSLKNEAAKTNDAWCASTLNKLKEAAPLSLKVSLRSIREGRFQTLDQCLIREYRMSLQGISGKITKDFFEGVRAKLVHKDFTPKWDPPSLEHVSEDMVDEYFTPLTPFEPELDLPTKQREAFI